MALVRGKSDHRDLDFLAKLIHIVLYALRVWVYFEWIESKSNWSDGISREGAGDPWLARHSFDVSLCHIHLELWQLPFSAALRVASFL